MLRTLVALGAAITLVSCGGTEPQIPLDPGFTATWSGTGTWIGAYQVLAPPTSLVGVTASGSTATVTGLCPDGSGSIVVTGSGKLANWSGGLPCPTFAATGCPSIDSELTSAVLILNADGTSLKVQVVGTAFCNGAVNAVRYGIMWNYVGVR